MNTTVKNTELESQIFSVTASNFNLVALEVFRFQHQHNLLYQQYCNLLGINVDAIDRIEKIPFLPVTFFKSHLIKTTEFAPELIFESSGTTGTVNSKHLIKDLSLYLISFKKAFTHFYGAVREYCILGLLPSYLEKNNSSLVLMVDTLIKDSHHPLSGFYLRDFERLAQTLHDLERSGKKTLLIGVTFALLDFAEQFPMKLDSTIIMETGGMKGRRREMTREEVHFTLNKAFATTKIHSEYGMTELLSQAYSQSEGIFFTPYWMKILIRNEDDPLSESQAVATKTIQGVINVIDLANLYSCSFIATEDAGKLHPTEGFEVIGRIDNTDIRGCSLLAI